MAVTPNEEETLSGTMVAVHAGPNSGVVLECWIGCGLEDLSTWKWDEP